MSRKPIDQQQPHECRQAIWEWICAQKGRQFYSTDIDVKLHESSIRDYLTALTNGGYLDLLLKAPRFGGNIYMQIKDCGVDAPRLKKDGTPVTQGQGQQYMWNAMPILKTFSAYDLALNASTDDVTISVQTAISYITALCKAGYLVGLAEQRYQLLPGKWTGPHPPQIQRTKQIYDPNLKRVVWSKIEGGAE